MAGLRIYTRLLVRCLALISADEQRRAIPARPNRPVRAGNKQ